MAQKRMFSLSVVDTDRFLEMPVSAQALYFHLGMHGDDDGFVASPRKIARSVGCNLDDLRLLAQKNFIIPFESGVIVIVDWNINNTLKNDRYNPTTHQAEKELLIATTGGAYVKKSDVGIPLVSSTEPTSNQFGTKLEPVWNRPGTSMEPQHNITEHNIDKHRVEGAEKPPRAPANKKTSRFVPPTVAEVRAYCQERQNAVDAQRFVDYYTANGWTQGRGKPIKDWRAAVRTWEGREAQRPAIVHPAPAALDYDLSGFLGGEADC